MIAGGFPSDSIGNSVELYIPSTGVQCQLTDLPGPPRYHFSSEGLSLCGGWDTRTSCITLTDGTWQATTTLLENRCESV